LGESRCQTQERCQKELGRHAIPSTMAAVARSRHFR
jgi:hypothetical protein